MSDAAVVLVVLGVAVVAFVSNKVPVGVVAVVTTLTLLATGVIDAPTALGGFGDPVVVFIATLFVVAEGLESSGVTAWAGRTLTARVGNRRGPLTGAVAGLSGVISALITPNGAAATMLPVVTTAARRADVSPSRLLIPTAFGASAGALLTLAGSPVNVLVHEASVEAGGGGFGFFEFAGAGVPLLVGTVVVVAVLGHVLPDRGPGPLVGDIADHVDTLVEHYDLEHSSRAALVDQEVGLVEVVVPPRSGALGRTVFPGMQVAADVTVLGVVRLGRDLGARHVQLAQGDALLLRGTWSSVETLGEEFLVVGAPEQLRRQLSARRPAVTAVVVLVAMVVALASGITVPAVAGLAAAVAMVALGVVRPSRVYRAISWQTLVLIGALIPLSVAVRDSGAADLVASRLMDVVGDNRLLALAAVFVLTAALGQVVSNAATVLVVIPVALAVAADAGIGTQTMLMTVAVAGAASLLTPIATPANMIVMTPGGYRFGDYWRLGAVTMLVYLVVALAVVPALWGLG
ncbi:MAG: SLC13 family permease [Micrococcales bacterium]|nr:SLC13 family permease [Micrococcales bacterium]MCL2667778.1 SLC13 family permease [Micrococcales bacterium]